jgi:NADPH-dependent glutamate synthase beta subunit-like oxidoreductase/Pyruvate/2-oxoacid:ferredoxin oxidoreductase delta subunit
MNAPALPPSTWTTGTTEVIRTGTWRAAVPVYRQAPSPCRLACPVDGRIAEWMQQAKAGDFHGAWITLTDHNPFPAVVGRVCHRPCEAACNRGGYDEPLAVRSLERYIGDLALAERWCFPQSPIGQERVAVIGGGPSGLSAAYQLRRRGYAVSIYEAQRELGGLLRDGIPPYRLPRAVLDGEIRRILALGIDVHASIALTRPEQFLRLREQYGAVYVAIGARRRRHLAQLDYVAPWVMDGAAYLAAANAGSPPALGKRVVAIGGGSAAMDVARSARRAGHEVSVLSLEREAEMPAQREEVLAAKEEGVRLFDGAVLKSVSVDGALTLHCVRVGFENSDFFIDAEAIIPAIGQDPELEALRPLLDIKGFFAGGDVVSPARFVSHAIGMGREAALEIDAWLMDSRPAPATAQAPVPLSAINTFYHPHRESSDPLTEAARCFSCGRCTLCDNCFQYCPDMAVRRVAGGYEIALEYCKGCGLCVAECPTGSIAMQEERK